MSDMPPVLAELLASGQIKRLQVVIDLEIPTPPTLPVKVPVVTWTVGAPRMKE